MKSLANTSRKYIIAGCVSQIFLVLYASLNLLAGSSPSYMLFLPTLTGLTIEQRFDVDHYYERSGAIGIDAIMIFVVFIILLSFTLQKTANTFGSQVASPVLGVSLGLIASLFGWFYYRGVSNHSFYWAGGTPFLTDLIPFPKNDLTLGILFLAFVSCTMMSYGLFFKINNDCFRSRNLARATGILFISASMLELSVLLEIAGTVTIMVAGIVGLACFLRGFSTP